jgi:hypothetical protein
MKTLLRLLLKTHHQRNPSGPAHTEKGMTLVELLVGSIMAFLIITPMLSFVVDMLNTDRREQVKSNTEQDIQAAVDFIAQDLSQAIYIYDNNPTVNGTPNTISTGIPAIQSQLPSPANGTPILVFWKRQQIKNAVPIDSTKQPSDCSTVECNDTYVLSLVAYYQFKDSDATWCQPSGGTCPTRIARYEIRDGVKNPYPNAPSTYYYPSGSNSPYAPDRAFNSTDPTKSFNLNIPTVNVTSGDFSSVRNDVLVNYIDYSKGPTVIDPAECQTALGNPTTQTGTTTTPIPEKTLKITDNKGSTTNTNSFYACVDTSKNIAKVTIRGNSLRRLQTDANYDDKKSAFFPTASVQVQGLGARGK